jgi:hypothetical protein
VDNSGNWGRFETNWQRRNRDPFGVMISRILAQVSHSDRIMAFLLSTDRDGQW